MAERTKTSVNVGGCGCFSFVMAILTLWALVFGLPTSWGVLNIDLFPPGVYLTK